MPDSIHPSAFVHPSAVVDEGAVLHEGAKVWHFCHVMPEAVIGPNSSLGQNAFVARGVTLGANVKVQNNVSLYEGISVEDDVFLGPSCVFTNVRNPRSAVNRRGDYEPTLVKRGATVGANATIRCGVTLGDHCFVAAGAVVTENVAAHALVAGVPAKQLGWMSAHGCRLAFDDQGRATCPESGQAYQLQNNKLHLA
ncbi:MAG: DapH/DapD/GlmU-related protein [Bacteroidetes bacterium]|nr:DapH/DapD/GlmU-related protein [Bacteroidota bacterium]